MNFIKRNKITILAVALVLCLTLTINLVRAQDAGDGSLLDKIVLTYLQLKMGASDGLESAGEAIVGIGGMAVENYIPIIRSNQGYYSEYGITTTGTLSADDVTVTDDLTVGGELALGDATMTCINVTFTDATTTPLAVAASSLFSSGTSTITSFTYNQQGVSTSTIAVDCGVAADAFTSADTLIDGLSISTSSTAYEVSGYGTNGNTADALGVNQYITCTVSGSITAGVTNVDNTYSGTATICAVQ